MHCNNKAGCKCLKDVWLTVAELQGKPNGGWRSKTCCKGMPVYGTGGITAHRIGELLL